MKKEFTTREMAYLILAHEDVAMLNILVARLVKTGDVFVHLDKGSTIKMQEINTFPNLQVYSEFVVKWGGWSIVQATQLLADKAISSGHSRLTLLSGVSYPIVSDEKLIELSQSKTDIFEARNVDLNVISRTFKRRFTTRHLEFKMQNSLFSRIVRRASREFFNLLPKLDPIKEMEPVKISLGSQWWSVTSDTYLKSMELVEKYPNIEKYFKKIECSDESFFSSLFNRVSVDNLNRGTTYLVFGNKGRPAIIQNSDIDQEGKFFFARKLSSSQREVIDSLQSKK